MVAVQLVGVAVLVTVLLAFLRPLRPELSLGTGLAAALVVALFFLPQVGQVVRLLESLATQAGLDPLYLRTILKIIGIAYLVGFASQLSRDAGERALAETVEFAGKALILVAALPVFYAVLSSLLSFMPHR
ncbi:MAG: stage III sporulation protein AD [Firmicutes bacterium]|nr:stage III sporulation protein AD [Bacillota bacterium]